MELSWKYVRPLMEKDSLKQFEENNSLKIPKDLKESIINNNSGRPSRKAFDTESSVGRVFSNLLSFNENDPENIYGIFESFEKKEKMVPFALDPFGNLICFDKENHSIILWLHETKVEEYIAESYTEFLDKLYEF